MGDRLQPAAPPTWNPAGVPSLVPKPPQRYTVAEFPSVESAVKSTTGVTLPFVDLTRGPGSLVNNAATIASSPLLKGLMAPTYAENEMIPEGLSPMQQDAAYEFLASEQQRSGQEDAMRAWANEPVRDSGQRVRSMKDLLSGRRGG